MQGGYSIQPRLIGWGSVPDFDASNLFSKPNTHQKHNWEAAIALLMSITFALGKKRNPIPESQLHTSKYFTHSKG
jgi:hypothetical protein